jgi:hypothetical protein
VFSGELAQDVLAISISPIGGTSGATEGHNSILGSRYLKELSRQGIEWHNPTGWLGAHAQI